MCAKMTRLLAALLLVTLISSAVSQEIWRPRHLGTHPQKHAAFIQVFETREAGVDPLDKYTLYLSTFNGATLFQVHLILRKMDNIININCFMKGIIFKFNYIK
jgi:hypothetical protein